MVVYGVMWHSIRQYNLVPNIHTNLSESFESFLFCTLGNQENTDVEIWTVT